MADGQGASKQLTSLGQIPGVRQMLLLTGIALSVAVGVVIVLWARGPSYNLLYSRLTDHDAGQVVEALEAGAIPYRLEPSSGAIMVPAEHVHHARLKLAAQGLPQGSGMGLELIEQENGFGVSQFIETARYHHMLETELVRTIASLQPVQGARVHLALPKQSVFVRERKPASASVVVQLYPGRRLEDAQVAAIVHLVAASVPEVEAGEVTVVDQHGRLLTSPESTRDLALTTQQFEHVRRVEESYAGRIEALLTPLAGPGRVHANVTLDMDFTVAEETRETYDPQRPSLRSEQLASEDRTGDAAAALGIPGALSNQPPVAPPEAPAEATEAPAAEPPRSSSRSSLRNYELDRTVAHIRQPSGEIQRIAVAVIVDDKQRTGEGGEVENVPLSAEELARFTNLVKETVGFDEARGDTVSVTNASFYAAEVAPVDGPAWWEQPLLHDLVKQILGAVLVLGVLMVLVRPIVRNLLQPPPLVPALPPGAARGGDEATPALAQGAESAPPLARSWEQGVAAARSVAAEDPKRVAQVVKSWMNTDG